MLISPYYYDILDDGKLVVLRIRLFYMMRKVPTVCNLYANGKFMSRFKSGMMTESVYLPNSSCFTFAFNPLLYFQLYMISLCLLYGG